MRDITPKKKRRRNLPQPAPSKPTPETSEFDSTPSSKPLTGATVGVGSIGVADTASTKDATTAPADTTPSSRRVSKRAQFKKTTAPRPRVGRRERVIIGWLLLLVLVVSGLAALLFLPRADIELVLRTAPLLVEEDLQLRSGDTSGAAGIIPSTSFFREVAVSGSSAVTTRRVIGAKATGTVVIVNRSIEEQSIKERSRLETSDGTLFYMTERVTLPAASTNPVRVPVTVEAAEAGEAGNIEPQRLDFPGLPEASRSLLYAEATDALSGGSGDTVPEVAEDDIARAQQHAGSEARVQVQEAIEAELPEGWTLLEESWVAEILEFDTPVSLEAEEEVIPYEARVAVRAMAYQRDELMTALRQSLESRIDDEYMLFPGEVSFSGTVDDIDWESGSATLSARVTHTTIPQMNVDSLQDKLAGQPQDAANTYLEGLPGIRSVTISLSPFWVNSIPRITSRIDITLTPERQP